MAGALLIELTLLERVDITEAGATVKPGRLEVLDPAPLDDPVLDRALRVFAEKQGKKPKTPSDRSARSCGASCSAGSSSGRRSGAAAGPRR